MQTAINFLLDINTLMIIIFFKEKPLQLLLFINKYFTQVKEIKFIEFVGLCFNQSLGTFQSLDTFLLQLYIYIYIYIYIRGGFCHWKWTQWHNTGQDCLHFTSKEYILEKGINSTLLPPAMGKWLGRLRSLTLNMTTSLGEGKH